MSLVAISLRAFAMERVCSLFVGVAAAGIDLVIGALWGGIAGLSGGKTDEIMMRVADILFAIPYLLMVILMMVVIGSGLIPILAALTMIGWIGMARIVRGQVLQLKEQEFVLAARALGASSSRLLFKHLLPNAMGPILVTATLTVPAAIFTEAFLSFLGLGMQAPIASWVRWLMMLCQPLSTILGGSSFRLFLSASPC